MFLHIILLTFQTMFVTGNLLLIPGLIQQIQRQEIKKNQKLISMNFWFTERRKRDSNPRSADKRTTVFKTAAFDHSAISPVQK